MRTYRLGVHKGRRDDVDLPYYAAYVQDDWKMTDRLTLNLGVRYDLTVDSFAQYGEFEPFMEKGRPQDADNIQPRLGFAYQLNDRTVMRGGAGKYYAEVITPVVLYALEPATIAVLEVANDGRPGLRGQPVQRPGAVVRGGARRGSARRRSRRRTSRPGRRATSPARSPCVLRGAGEMAPPADYAHVPQTWQATIGVQRQIGTAMSVEADYVYSRGRDEKFIQENVNLSFTNASGIGINNPYTNRALLPYPQFGIVAMTPFTATSAYHALQTAFTKRLSNNWQAGATYSLAGLWSAEGQPLMGVPGRTPVEVPFAVAEDLGGPGGWTYALSDQRHRAVFNGIWQVGHGFQLSGLHYWGAGNRSSSNYGADRRNLGAGGEGRLRPDGTIVPKNSFIQPPQNNTVHPGTAADSGAEPRVARPDCRGVQRVQPSELDARDAGEQCRLRRAGRRAVPLRAVWFPADVLRGQGERDRGKGKGSLRNQACSRGQPFPLPLAPFPLLLLLLVSVLSAQAAKRPLPFSDVQPVLESLREDLLPVEFRGLLPAPAAARWPEWVARVTAPAANERLQFAWQVIERKGIFKSPAGGPADPSIDAGRGALRRYLDERTHRLRGRDLYVLAGHRRDG